MAASPKSDSLDRGSDMVRHLLTLILRSGGDGEAAVCHQAFFAVDLEPYFAFGIRVLDCELTWRLGQDRLAEPRAPWRDPSQAVAGRQSPSRSFDWQ